MSLPNLIYFYLKYTWKSTQDEQIPRGILHMAINTFHISIASVVEEKRKKLDYFIEPEKLKRYTYYDVKRGREMFDIGYEKAMEVLKE